MSRCFPCWFKNTVNKISPNKRPFHKITLNESGSDSTKNDQQNFDELISTRDDPEAHKKFPKNIMRFQKYNVLTFLPVF